MQKELMPAFDQIERHGFAHDAETYKTDVTHLGFLFNLSQ
jgi:hypothetical protein